MKKNKQFLFVIILLSTIIGCSKKDLTSANLEPTIWFVTPDTNLVLKDDSVLTFLTEVKDLDGSIEKVEFYINGFLVYTDFDKPYSFDFGFNTVGDFGRNTVKAIAYDNLGATGAAEINIDVKSYLLKWVGFYTGTSDHWTITPATETHNSKKVLVEVQESLIDSCLNLILTYNDTVVQTKKDLKFSTSGVHFSQWGGGSSYGSLSINLKTDTVEYHSFQKCGIPCNSGVDFIAKKSN